MLTLMFPNEERYVARFLDECGNPQSARCIDGSVTSQSKCGGYCCCNLHPGYLTQSHISAHRCVEKECAYYYKRTANPHKPESTMKNLKKYIALLLPRLNIEHNQAA